MPPFAEPEINEERVRLGVEGLRSGRFRKGVGTLHRLAGEEPGPDDEYCCLGALSVIARENGCPVESRIVGGERGGIRREMFGDQESEFLSDQVRLWFGFASNNPNLRTTGGRFVSATSWNDRGPDGEALNPQPEEDFGPIAEAFERTYLRPA